MTLLSIAPSGGFEQVRFKFGNHILQCVLTKVCEIHKRGNASRELTEIFLNLLTLRLVFSFFLRQVLPLLLCGLVSITLLVVLHGFAATKSSTRPGRSEH